MEDMGVRIICRKMTLTDQVIRLQSQSWQGVELGLKPGLWTLMTISYQATLTPDCPEQYSPLVEPSKHL